MFSQSHQILSNTLAQLVAKAGAVLLTLLSTFYFLRIGGPGLFGEYSAALALIAIGFTGIDFGLNAHAVREMQGGRAARRQLFLSTLLARLLLSLLAILLANLVVLFLPGAYSGQLRQVFWLGSLAIIFQGFYTTANAWFQRHLQYWSSALATLVGTTLGTALTLYLIFTRPTLGNLLAVTTLGYAVMGLLALHLTGQLPLTRLLRSFKQASHSASESLSLLRGSLYLGLILIFSILASKLDIVILGVFRESSEVGQYAFAYRLFDVALVLPVFTMNSLYPLLLTSTPSQRSRLLKRSTTTLAIIALLASAALYPLAPLISLIRPDMPLAISSFRTLILFLPLFFLTAPLMWDLIARRLERPLLLVYLAAGLLNASLNLALIPFYGAPAAAVNTGITELFILLCLLYLRRKAS